MKHSIKKIFLNLNTYLFFVLFSTFIGMMVTLEQELSFKKVNNLNNQKEIIKTLTKLEKKDIELALIQFNGKSMQLLQDIDKLKTLYSYDYTSAIIFNRSNEYLKDLNKLTQLTKAFNKAAHKFYIEEDDKRLTKIAKKNLHSAYIRIITHINHILFKNTTYDEEKYNVIKYLSIIIFCLVFFATFLYRKRLNSIYKDIEFLYQVDKNKRSHYIYSLEADAISLRMKRKTVVTDNPSMLDPVTGINNHKGMIHSYSNKKNLNDSSFTSVTLLEIDNFSKSKRTFTQEMTQAILKKIAYTISLHEQPVDIIARTDYNQFTLILSRASKEQSFKDIELIRQSIEGLKFHIPNQGQVTITVSGGFIIKPNNTYLEEAIKQSKEILAYAKSMGKNKILQTRDLAERDI